MLIYSILKKFTLDFIDKHEHNIIKAALLIPVGLLIGGLTMTFIWAMIEIYLYGQ